MFFKFIVISVVIHVIMFTGLYYLNAIPELTFEQSNHESFSTQKTKLGFIKLSHLDLIKKEISRQENVLSKLSDKQKLSLLDSHLNKLSSLETTDKISQLVLNQMFSNQAAPKVTKTFCYENYFFKDVSEDDQKNITICLEDYSGNILTYRIPKDKVTPQDRTLLTIFEKSKKSPHLRLILKNFAKMFKKNQNP